jgi:RNA polymerase sigma-70 factor (ECF subfamily)
MEAISTISSSAEIKQHNSITARQSSLELCKNRKVMPLKDLLASITKKLMSYAMMLTSNNEDDAWDLIQSTIEKLIKNKETLQASNQPVAYAKRILKNNFIDNYRKQKRLDSIEANDIAISNEGFQEVSVEYQEMLRCLETFDETDRTILMMLGKGHSYKEIQEVVGDISMANLRVKANRARINLANCMGREL